MREYCEKRPHLGHGAFYFSFSDKHNQTYEDLLLSLVAQFGHREPGFEILGRLYGLKARKPGREEQERILLASLASFDLVFCHLDALDECPETDGVRQRLLQGIRDIAEQAPNLQILVTSRDESDIRRWIAQPGTVSIPVARQVIDADIRRYVKTQMNYSSRLSRLDPATKIFVEETLLQKADGMYVVVSLLARTQLNSSSSRFRWVYCQLQELNKSKSTSLNAIRADLISLPKTLDETYERMLTRIDDGDRAHALVLLRWLTYSYEPLTLEQLAEASIIDPTDDPSSDGLVDLDNKGNWDDTLNILTGLIVVAPRDQENGSGTADEQRSEGSDQGDKHRIVDNEIMIDGELDVYRHGLHISKDTKVRLAHFSVKEYLQSSRIVDSAARGFHLVPSREHRFLTQSCLIYLTCYSQSRMKQDSEGYRIKFPLVFYAAQRWWDHAAEQMPKDNTRELRFLFNERLRLDCLSVYSPGQRSELVRFAKRRPALPHASFKNLREIVQGLIATGEDIDGQDGDLGSALEAAAGRGHDAMCRLLLDKGADVNGGGGTFGNALEAAAYEGHEDVINLLLDAGADVNARGGYHNNALQAAAARGHERICRLLLAAGANVNAWSPQGVFHYSALEAAAGSGSEPVARLLLDAGADVHVRASASYDTLLQAAAAGGRTEIVRWFLDAGADLNGRGGADNRIHHNALEAAVEGDHDSMLRMLLVAKGLLDESSDDASNTESDKSRSTKAQTPCSSGRGDIDAAIALATASELGKTRMVKLLLDAGVDVNTTVSRWGVDTRTPLARASMYGNEDTVQRLLDAGADIDFCSPHARNETALQSAASRGQQRMIQVLLEAGANVNARDGASGTVLHTALESGHGKIAQMILDSGADPMLVDQYGRSALVKAIEAGLEDVSQRLRSLEKNASEEDVYRLALVDASKRVETASSDGSWTPV
jgi:ankyrin repeat protein